MRLVHSGFVPAPAGAPQWLSYNYCRHEEQATGMCATSNDRQLEQRYTAKCSSSPEVMAVPITAHILAKHHPVHACMHTCKQQPVSQTRTSVCSTHLHGLNRYMSDQCMHHSTAQSSLQDAARPCMSMRQATASAIWLLCTKQLVVLMRMCLTCQLGAGVGCPATMLRCPQQWEGLCAKTRVQHLSRDNDCVAG